MQIISRAVRTKVRSPKRGRRPKGEHTSVPRHAGAASGALSRTRKCSRSTHLCSDVLLARAPRVLSESSLQKADGLERGGILSLGHTNGVRLIEKITDQRHSVIACRAFISLGCDLAIVFHDSLSLSISRNFFPIFLEVSFTILLPLPSRR